MIRLYGNTVGFGSFARVLYGMAAGLKDNRRLAGVFPTDVEDAQAPGHDAPVAVYSGDFERASFMLSHGWHKERLILFPVNSSWAPTLLIQSLERIATGFIAPSTWAQNVLQRYTDLPVYLWHHGVDRGFLPPEHRPGAQSEDYSIDGKTGFDLLHLSSTAGERKGTHELIQSWRRREANFFHDRILHIGCPAPLQLDANDGCFQLTTRLDLDPEHMGHVYRQYHAIVQPSRAEGFGMVPLEARVAGVPVIMTDCTGHNDHFQLDAASVLVESGPDAPIDDGPGAMAPSVSVDQIYYALIRAQDLLSERRQEARRSALRVYQNWSWSRVTSAFLQVLREAGKL